LTLLSRGVPGIKAKGAGYWIDDARFDRRGGI
jgi:hypothetical protein